jgi:hypothetical protein
MMDWLLFQGQFQRTALEITPSRRRRVRASIQIGEVLQSGTPYSASGQKRYSKLIATTKRPDSA